MKVTTDKTAWIAAGCPEGIRGLDLAMPAMLEASAGTGKTYAVEHLVLRILTESDGIDLGQVLVLTYTEKATGELKEKIRNQLARRVADGSGLPAPVLARLREAYLNFDRACIFTIHGFCQRVLRNYAFENRALFHHELADDAEILEEVLTEEMRSTWLSDQGPEGAGLEGFRRLTQRMGVNVSGKWKGKWLDLARSWNPDRGDRLLPEPDRERAAALEHGMLAACEALQAELGGTAGGDANALGKETENEAYAALKAGIFTIASRKKSCLLMMSELIRLAAAAAAEPDPKAKLGLLRGFLNEHYRKNLVTEGFHLLLPDSWPEGADPGRGRCERAAACMDRIRLAARERKQVERAMDFDSQRKVITALRQGAKDLKRERGIHSFDDMIQDLSDAIGARPELVAALQRQFRYCIVDEFQDTDPLQWKIFKRVFLESEGANPLYLIGDPKQAIYGFRGGDIHTYLEARSELHNRSREGRAAGLGLDANFRSARRMIEACNKIFVHPNWFRKGETDPGDPFWRLSPVSDPRGYADVRYGGLAKQECLETDGQGPAGTIPAGTPIILRDFSGETKKGPAQRKIHQWIVSEILELIAAPERMRLPDGAGGYRDPDWGDICVLIRTKSEKHALEAAFRKAGIPFQVHKLPGLYRSDAALHFLAVLESLEDPADPGKHARALLTRFFRAAGDPAPTAPPADVHPAFDAWKRFADRRQWQRLFQAMLYQTGLLYRESLEPDGERRVMDFMHVGQNLVREALKENLSLTALAQRLREWKEETPDAEEERHLHREDSERRKVAVMTMHTSKGLEFPVVFVAGLSEFSGASVLRYHANGERIFHLDAKDQEAIRAAGEEDEDEKRRLFYVALTRAKYRMYIPLPPPAFWRSTCSLGGFVADGLRAARQAAPELFHMVPETGAASASEAIRPETWAALAMEADSRAPSLGPVDAALAKPIVLSAPVSLDDFPEGSVSSGPAADFSRRKRRLTSYSLLVRHAPDVAAEGLEGRYDKDEAPALETGPFEDEDETASRAAIPGNAIPRGKETGNMLHAIMEDISFHTVMEAENLDALLAVPAVRGLFEARMAEYRMDATHLGDVARVVWNTLRTPLPDPVGGPPFALGSAPDRMPEMEFLFPHPSGMGFLWGYIDLVFRKDGFYYLLDWKSNWLESYRPAEIGESMLESRYDLQYKLYALALGKWLRNVIPDYSYDRHFGGVYYVYLRGMGPQGSGAWIHRPSADDLAANYPAELDRALAAAGVLPPGVSLKAPAAHSAFATRPSASGARA
jgi:exodeoxyribonuclease V beta subunit